MGVYLINFLVYSMAMVGLLFICLMIYKKTMVENRFSKNDNELKVENALNLSQRKTLYVVKAGNEKFLIAADLERTSFLAKLNNEEIHTCKNIVDEKKEALYVVPQKKSQTIDYSEVMNAIIFFPRLTTTKIVSREDLVSI